MTHNQLIKNTQNLKGVSISKIEENAEGDTLYVYIQLYKKLQGICPHCHKHAPGYNSKTQKREWRALDMGTQKIILVSDVHRVNCPEHGVVTEDVTWALHGSRFTKKFEQQVAYLTVHQSKKLVCEQMRINWRTVGSIVSRVQKAKEKDPKAKYENLEAIGIDETSHKKGHTYLTTVVNHATGEVIWVHDGFGSSVLENSLSKLVQRLLLKSRWSVVMVPDGLKIQSVNMPLRLFSALTRITLSRGLLTPWIRCAAASGGRSAKLKRLYLNGNPAGLKKGRSHSPRNLRR